VSRGVATLLRTNKKKATIIEDEQRKERKGATIVGDFDKMKDKRNGNSYW
jgi:hypothetical protein